MKLQSDKLEFSYADANGVFRSLDISPLHFRRLALLGFSGVGKSTLLKIVTGLLMADSGSVKLSRNGSGPVTLGYVAQAETLLPWLSIGKNISLSNKLVRARPECVPNLDRAHLLREFALEQAVNRLPHQLSGGMRKRAALVSALLSDASLLVLDEPFVGSDASNRKAMYQAIHSACDSNDRAAIFTTHDAVDVVELADTVLWLEQSNPTTCTVIDASAGWTVESREKLSSLMLGGG